MGKNKKSKKKAPVRQFKGLGKRALSSELQKAEVLIEEGEFLEAKTFLLELQKTYPREPEVLKPLVDVYLEIGDDTAYIRVVEQLIDLEPQEMPMAFGLAKAYHDLDLSLSLIWSLSLLRS